MDTLSLVDDVGVLAQRIRLNAINLAVAAAKVKISDPSFKAANERIVQLVTRSTEVASRVDRLSRQISGQAREQDQQISEPDTLEHIQQCLRDVEEISDAVIAEIELLHVRARARA